MQMDKNHFDREEQQIYEAFSKIEVRHTDMAERVMRQVQDTPKLRVLPVKRRVSFLAVALVILLVSTTALAVGLGGFDWFMERFEPTFAEVVEPIGAYAEDQGIRMTVIGAQEIGGMAIMYLSVQDVSGAAQLAQYMSIADDFFLGMKWFDVSYGGGMSQAMLYFDEITSTAYFAIEFEISADPETTFTDPLELGIGSLIFHADMFREKPMDLSLTDLLEKETIALGWNYMFSGVFRSDDFEVLPASLQVLTPGDIGTLPHGDSRQWLSNIGIVDGQLRVQYGGCYVERNKGIGPGDAFFTLVSPAGEIIQPVLGVPFLLDEAFELIRLDRYFAGEDNQTPTYRFMEFVFDVDPDRLPYYKLAFTGQGNVFKIHGDWRVPVDTSGDGLEVILWTEEIFIDDMVIEFMRLSPLGLQVWGHRSENFYESVQVELETQDDLISLPWGSGNADLQAFSFSRRAGAPIDVRTVTAIVINGHRIPLE